MIGIPAYIANLLLRIFRPTYACVFCVGTHALLFRRCTPEQKEIYYLCAPNRDLAEASPYYEAFRASGREVG